MKKHLFQDMDDEQRKQALEDNADQITKGKYTKRLQSEELNRRRKRICEIELEVSDIDDEVKVFKDSIKERREPLMQEKRTLLADIKAGGQYVEGKLYKFIDRDKRMVGLYNEDGDLVDERRMTKEDAQLSINDAFKQAAEL